MTNNTKHSRTSTHTTKYPHIHNTHPDT